MKMRGMGMAVLAIGLGAGAGSAQVPDSVAMASAERFVGLLRDGEWVAAERMVIPSLRVQLGASALEMVWGQMVSSWGAFEAMRGKGVTTRDTLQAVELFGDFANDTVLLRVVLSSAQEVVGFWVGPVPEAQPAPARAPPYADASKFREVEVQVGSDPWVLPGTLSIPAESGRGIAVLRYEKRTKTHGARMGGAVTLDSE